MNDLVKKSLYGLTRELEEHFEKYQDETLDSSLALQQLTRDIEFKTEGVVGYLEQMSNTIDRVADKIKEIQDIKKVLEKRKERFEEYIILCLKAKAMASDSPAVITVNDLTLKVTKNPYSVIIENENDVPVIFAEVQQKIVIKKSDILAHFKSTGEIPEGTRITQTERLTIKKY